MPYTGEIHPNRDFFTEVLSLAMIRKWKEACFLFIKLTEQNRSPVPNRFIIREVVKYID